MAYLVFTYIILNRNCMTIKFPKLIFNSTEGLKFRRFQFLQTFKLCSTKARITVVTLLFVCRLASNWYFPSVKHEVFKHWLHGISIPSIIRIITLLFMDLLGFHIICCFSQNKCSSGQSNFYSVDKKTC